MTATPPRPPRITITLALGWVAAAALGAGCTGPLAPTAGAPSGRPTATTTVTQTLAPPSAALPGEYTWDDGLRVAIGKPREHRLNRWAQTEELRQAVRFKVTVTNDTSAPVALTDLRLTATSDGRAARALFEVNLGIRGVPAITLAPGKHRTFWLAFAVKDNKQLEISITPGAGDEVRFIA